MAVHLNGSTDDLLGQSIQFSEATHITLFQLSKPLRVSVSASQTLCNKWSEAE